VSFANLNHQEIVSYAGPLIKAGVALTAADDLFERRKFAEGVARLRVVQQHAEQAIQFILKTEKL
jgi:hypothetical protein